MKLLSLTAILGILLLKGGCSFQCHRDTHTFVDLNPAEKDLLHRIRIALDANEVHAEWSDKSDTTVPRDLIIILTNSNRVKINDPGMAKSADMIADSLVVINRYINKYKTIRVVFKEISGIFPFESTKTSSYFWNEQKMAKKMAKLTSPVSRFTAAAVVLEREKNYLGMIALADSTDNGDTAISEVCERVKALAWMDLRDTVKALQHFLVAKNLNPNDKQNWINIAYVYACQQEYKQALPYLDSALLVEPKDGSIYCRRSRYEHGCHMNEAACNDAHKAAAMGYQDAVELVRLYCE
jgi:tetratricopeptide (TPR) repeat protein